MRSPLPCAPLSHPLSNLPHLPPLPVAVFLPQAVRDTLELLIPPSADLAILRISGRNSQWCSPLS
ncbi:hypothetical protein M405DRAFT_834913 [Rhizopogon salebrosus TDB-379]|nr:hypothetical protein M405DRAFT_834913 [Rhizopogon salebrosus TDB-379]